jgi:hypothetical protein
VLHEHVGHAGVDRQRPQQVSERVQSARRGPHADDGKGVSRWTSLLRVANAGYGLGLS